jgi:hypothetical protein
VWKCRGRTDLDLLKSVKGAGLLVCRGIGVSNIIQGLVEGARGRTTRTHGRILRVISPREASNQLNARAGLDQISRFASRVTFNSKMFPSTTQAPASLPVYLPTLTSVLASVRKSYRPASFYVYLGNPHLGSS